MWRRRDRTSCTACHGVPRPAPAYRVEWCQTRILQWLGLIGWFDATSAPLPGTMRSDQAPHHQTEEHLTGEHYRDAVRRWGDPCPTSPGGRERGGDGHR